MQDNPARFHSRQKPRRRTRIRDLAFLLFVSLFVGCGSSIPAGPSAQQHRRLSLEAIGAVNFFHDLSQVKHRIGWPYPADGCHRQLQLPEVVAAETAHK